MDMNDGSDSSVSSPTILSSKCSTQAGQFLGSRHDFVPKEICQRLCRLHDQVPPMPAKQVEELLKEEFKVTGLHELFEWIDLETPLGSASIAQVHKARLRQPPTPPQRSLINRIVRSPIRLVSAIAGEHDAVHLLVGITWSIVLCYLHCCKTLRQWKHVT